MPTPVSTARQCLTAEAARALDDAVSVARRRSHAQTTSLHAISALLALPSSTLREACTRGKTCDYSPRLQFRALELCVSVSLDRLPSTKIIDEPPVSNSLMAAIKRSQANQRRHPDTFHLYQQMQHQNQNVSLTSVKVELKHFILSILDDPIVSRVFGDAGFRSYDIKLAILRPPSISRNRLPLPVFLCNLPDSGPFFTGDENCRRIAEVLKHDPVRHPLLIGVCAKDALSNFTESVGKGEFGEMDGLSVICVGEEICEFVCEGESKERLDLKFKELGDMVGSCQGCGVVVNYGELKVFVDGGLVDAVKYVVLQLTRLVEVHGRKLWLIGAAATDEVYAKFLARFPSIEKDWDLYLLPITSSKSKPLSHSKSSLMGSFVPFGGFFPTPSEFENMQRSTNQSTTRCDHCNEKYEQEASVILKGGSTSVADHHSASLSSWLHKDDKRTDTIEAQDGGSMLNARLVGLQSKWNDICERLHRTQSLQRNIPQVGSYIPNVEGFQFDAGRKANNEKDPLLDESRFTNLSPHLPFNLQKISLPRPKTPILIASEAENANLRHKLPAEVTRMPLDHTSSSSINSVATDLGLGTLYASSDQEPRTGKFKDHNDGLQSFGGPVSANVSMVTKNALNHTSYSGPDLRGQLDEKDFKYLWRILSEKVNWQDEAICTVSQIVSSCRSGQGRRRESNQRGDIWLSFLGPDIVGKKIIAVALAEILFGSKESFISVNLDSEHGIEQSNHIFDRQGLNMCDVKFRGKTVVDYLAEEFRRKPRSVVLLENIDKADFPTQNSLSRAIKTGKFPDSGGREISINSMIFVMTTKSITKVHKSFLSEKNPSEFSEERILGAKFLQMQILVENVKEDVIRTSNPVCINKRKLIDTCDSIEQDNSSEISKRAHKMSKWCLDLNVPVEEMEEVDEYGNSDSDSSPENSQVWLEDFFDQVDEKVIFDPIDFDALAENVLKEIRLGFRKTVGFDVQLVIDQEVMVQILAADWLSERKKAVEEWIDEVLCRSFVESQQKHRLTAQSVVKLVAVEGLLVEEQGSHFCLPARIIVN